MYFKSHLNTLVKFSNLSLKNDLLPLRYTVIGKNLNLGIVENALVSDLLRSLTSAHLLGQHIRLVSKRLASLYHNARVEHLLSFSKRLVDILAISKEYSSISSLTVLNTKISILGIYLQMFIDNIGIKLLNLVVNRSAYKAYDHLFDTHQSFNILPLRLTYLSLITNSINTVDSSLPTYLDSTMIKNNILYFIAPNLSRHILFIKTLDYSYLNAILYSPRVGNISLFYREFIKIDLTIDAVINNKFSRLTTLTLVNLRLIYSEYNYSKNLSLGTNYKLEDILSWCKLTGLRAWFLYMTNLNDYLGYSRLEDVVHCLERDLLGLSLFLRVTLLSRVKQVVLTTKVEVDLTLKITNLLNYQLNFSRESLYRLFVIKLVHKIYYGQALYRYIALAST